MTKKRENLKQLAKAYTISCIVAFTMIVIAGCIIDSTNPLIWGTALASAFGSTVTATILGKLVKVKEKELKELEHRYSLKRITLK